MEDVKRRLFSRLQDGNWAKNQESHYLLLWHIHHTSVNLHDLDSMQVLDLHKYCIYSKKNKVLDVLKSKPRERMFKFVIHNN